jgi:hypothetical protein
MLSVRFAILASLLAAVPTLAAEPCLEERPGVSRSDNERCQSGYWAELKALDNCRFTFAAGLSRTASGRASSRPLKFRVSGGRCQPWPNRPLTAPGTSVLCVRSGNGSTTIALDTTDGVLKKVLAPLATRRVPDEPVLEKRRSQPQTEGPYTVQVTRLPLYRLRAGLPYVPPTWRRHPADAIRRGHSRRCSGVHQRLWALVALPRRVSVRGSGILTAGPAPGQRLFGPTRVPRVAAVRR